MTQDEFRHQEAELDDLYRDIIIDHYRHPRHRGHLERAERHARRAEPALRRRGDGRGDGGRTTGSRTSRTSGSGCSISQSSASMMTEAVAGKSLEEARHLIDEFTAMMRGSEDVDPEALGDLEALSGVRKFPVRIKCATLAWHTLDEALEDAGLAPSRRAARR